MSTPEELPNTDEALARAREDRPEMAAAIEEDQEREVDEAVGWWQPVWRRPRAPKSKAAKMQELCKQRCRLQDAATRRQAVAPDQCPAGQNRQCGRPPRCPRSFSGCSTPAPGCGDDAGHYGHRADPRPIGSCPGRVRPGLASSTVDACCRGGRAGIIGGMQVTTLERRGFVTAVIRSIGARHEGAHDLVTDGPAERCASLNSRCP